MLDQQENKQSDTGSVSNPINQFLPNIETLLNQEQNEKEKSILEQELKQWWYQECQEQDKRPFTTIETTKKIENVTNSLDYHYQFNHDEQFLRKQEQERQAAIRSIQQSQLKEDEITEQFQFSIQNPSELKLMNNQFSQLCNMGSPNLKR